MLLAYCSICHSQLFYSTLHTFIVMIAFNHHVPPHNTRTFTLQLYDRVPLLSWTHCLRSRIWWHLLFFSGPFQLHSPRCSSMLYFPSLLLWIVMYMFHNIASYIAMKISPFEKSTVSNIKDLILMLISVFVYHDFSITPISGVGLILCLIFSALFSLPYLQHTNKTNE